MNWYTAGKDANFSLDIMVDGEYAMPDAGSLKLTLRDNAGVIVSGYDQLPLADVSANTVPITVPAGQNSISSSTFEVRYVRLEYTVDSRYYSRDFKYRLSAFIPMQVTSEDVRNLIGASTEELPDSDIDLLESYFILLDQNGSELSTALLSGSAASLYANAAISLHAALALLPSLQGKLNQREKANNGEYERAKLNFPRLRADLEDYLVFNLSQIISSSIPNGPNLLAFSTPTDPITG